jgi:cytochrome c-type biogenesis protein CcmE
MRRAVFTKGLDMNRVALKIAIASVVFIGAISYLAYAGAKQAWVYHLTVDQFTTSPQYKTQRVRLCGTVCKDHFNSSPAQLTATFALKGTTSDVPIEYHGVIPDLFQAGRDVVIEGRLDTAGVFQADVLMTKCASKYEMKASDGTGGTAGGAS